MIKKILPIVICAMLVAACNKTVNETTVFSVVAANFICYDLARAVCGIGAASMNGTSSVSVNGTGSVSVNRTGMQKTPVNLQLILKPGTDLHSFDPSPKDIVAIEHAKIFIYTGGESDEWADKLLKTVKNPPLHIFKLMEHIAAEKDEHEHNHEADEHIWTSPANTLQLIDSLTAALSECNPVMADIYLTNAAIYKEEIENARNAIKNVLAKKEKRVIVMGDRFPLKSFAQEFGIEYYAAFAGCSSAVEASPAAVAKLINIIKEEKLPAVFTMELSNRRIAETIAESTGVKVLELNAAHNLTRQQFDAGMTYVDTLYANAESLNAGLR